MTDNLDNRTRRVYSVAKALQNQPIGVNVTRPAFQAIYAGAPVNEWSFEKVGEDAYHLSVGGYSYVGVAGGRVIASIHPSHAAKWKIHYHERQNAFTIVLVSEHKPSVGWTVASDGEGAELGRDIVIRPIVIGTSEPPVFLGKQLFSFGEPTD